MSTGSTTGHETEFINVQGLKASLKKGGNKGIFNEATCSTAASTAAKEITTAPKSFSLVAGAKILVTFANAISVANATLQVGSATAKPIYYHGAALAANMVKAGSVLLLAYDGTRFNIVGDLDTDTTYTDMVASGTNHKGGLVPDPGDTEGASKYLCEDGTWKTPPDTTYESKAAASGGTAVSLVTTGDKYNWNQKADKASVTAGDYNKVTVNSEGIVTSGSNPTTLAGHGITDAYTKAETYTKTEVNNLVDTPHQEYVTVATYASLPATGSKDTIYRVSNYNGSTSQVDATSYSEYAWNGSSYIFLCVKSQIDEVFDITAYNSNTKYADISAALGVDGANVPQTLRKGGMSIKFVQNSNNKYRHYKFLLSTFTDAEFAKPSNWEGFDEVYEEVFGKYEDINKGSIITAWIMSSDKWSTAGHKCYIIDVRSLVGEKIEIKSNSTQGAKYAFLTSDSHESGEYASYVSDTGLVQTNAGEASVFIIPTGCNYLYVADVYYSSPNKVYTPEYLRHIMVETLEERTKEYADGLVRGEKENISLNASIRSSVGISMTSLVCTASYGKFLIDVSGRTTDYVEIKSNNEFESRYALLANNSLVEGECPQYVDGYSHLYKIDAGQKRTFKIPSGCNYLYITYKNYNTQNVYTPEYVRYVSKEDIYDVCNPDVFTEVDPADIALLNCKECLDDRFTQSKGNTNTVNLIHFSDLHGDGRNLSRILQIYDRYKDYIDGILNTGDLVNNVYADSIAFMDIRYANKVLNVIGNHETRVVTDGVTDWSGATEKQCYDKFIAPFKSNWGVVMPTDIVDGDTVERECAYYYKDYADKNLMLIIYDVMHPNMAQNTWLTNVLSEARTNNRHVVIAMHSPHALNDVRDEHKVSCAFSSLTFVMNAVDYLSFNIKPIVQDFIDAGGIFVCYLCGHTHRDLICYNEDYPAQVSIVVSTASAERGNENYARQAYTVSGDLFNIVTINTDYKLLSLFRIGAKHDTFNRNIESMVFDYSNHQVVG